MQVVREKIRQSLQSTLESSSKDDSRTIGDRINENVTNFIFGDVFDESDKDDPTRPDETWLSQYFEHVDAFVRGGAGYAVFDVEYTGSVSETFSNDVEDSGIQSTLQAITGSTRSIKFNLGGLSAGDGIIGQMIDEVIGGLKAFFTNAASSVTFGLSNIIPALLGGGFIDVPKRWSNSSARVATLSYQTKLISPYGNPVSQLQKIYIPLCMLMAGALPLATGKQSYTSPFLCSIYNRGKQIVKLGIISSLTISRGTSNLGFTDDGRALAVDVNFEVMDLSSVMSMPIDTGGFFGIDMTLDEDHLLSTYLSTLSGRDLTSIQYAGYGIRVNIAKRWLRYSQSISPASFGTAFGPFAKGLFSPAVFGPAAIPSPVDVYVKTPQ
jgi:hypothetical protein